MLRLSSVSRSYDADPILRDVSFFLSSGERMGLVGPNGSGKSTLLRLVAGLDRPDSGSVWIDPADSVAYLPQYPADELERSARDSLLSGMSGLGDLQRRVAELEDRMAGASDGELQALLGEYAAVQGEFERLGGYEIDARLERVTRGLGLEPEALSMPVRALSGGNKTKLSLARLLLSGASVLLLDEPTNYLDLPALLWLERFVLESGASYLIVSHDRRFLDRTVHGILELDLEAHTLRRWAGNYTEYAEAREREEAKQLEEYQDQQEEKRRIEADIRRTKDQALGVEQSTKLDTTRRYAKKVAAKAKARERRLEKSLERHEVEKPRRSWGLDLGDLERRAEGERIDDDRTVLTVRDVRASYGEREVLRGASLDVRGRDRVALLGPNGSGKSTLLGCVLGRTPYEGEIRIGSNVRVGQMSQETRELPLYSPVLEVLRARTPMYEDEARTYLHKFLFSGEQVRQPVGTLSYGQRQKLALALLVLSDANFLVLDEPTSYLDMPALEAVEAALAGYVGPLLVVSHDRAFLQALGVNRVGVLERGVLRPVQSVEEYEEEVMADGGVRS